MMSSGHKSHDPADSGFQFFEDLATAYWYSQVLFSAIELELFRHLESGGGTVRELADSASCRIGELQRLLTAMTRMGLVLHRDGRFYNTQAASRFLVPEHPDYMGDFLLYRQYMIPRWSDLTRKVSLSVNSPEAPELSYEERNRRYVAAMDTLARQKGREIAEIAKREGITGPILDIGGGGGSLARALVTSTEERTEAFLFDIPEVIQAARSLYPDPGDWDGIETLEGDFRSHAFDRTFGLVCLSNFLHAYGPEEAKELLGKAISLLAPDGMLLIHDYFPDHSGTRPHKGALYDLTMMLNTYNGACHDATTLQEWCREAGLAASAFTDLETDTGIILAKQKGDLSLTEDPFIAIAGELGFQGIFPISPGKIVTVPWARQKCRYGCERFEKGLQCPPHGLTHDQTRRLIDSYSRVYLLRGEPPGKMFHDALLALEKTAFLDGHPKALVFGAGPCPVCPQCPDNGQCRQPERARPSMEASGIDVYTTAANAGLTLKPLTAKNAYVTYIGLLLVE